MTPLSKTQYFVSIYDKRDIHSNIFLWLFTCVTCTYILFLSNLEVMHHILIRWRCTLSRNIPMKYVSICLKHTQNKIQFFNVKSRDVIAEINSIGWEYFM